MKKILLIIAIIASITSNCYAISYNDEIKLSLNPVIPNTQTNINWAALIETYLLKINHDLELLKAKYDIKEDSENKEYSLKLNKMTISIKKIQTTDIEKYIAEDVMRSVIDELKVLNPKIKNYLKTKRELAEKETAQVKSKYTNFAQKLSISLEILINALWWKLEENKSNKNYESIKKQLDNLTKENQKLKNFKYIQFNNPSEIKSGFLRILNNIKRAILEIKKLIN